MERYERPKDDDLCHWTVPNSVIARDIVPTWRRLGGGVTERAIQPSLKAAYEQAIRYATQNVAAAQAHRRKLEKALSALLQSEGEI